MAWAEDYRQNWIAECLRVFGFIQRKHIAAKFGVSIQQASHDIVLFLKRNPGSMVYDKTGKRFVAGENTVREFHK